MDYKTYLENGMDEIEVKVEVDYDPYEPMTRHYPGASENVDICEVVMIDGGSEICLLPKAEDEMEEIVLDMIHDEQEYAKYGYMMEG